MFTVLIAEKKYIDAIQRENKLFFEPFLENKDLAFCRWNVAGQSLLDSTPDLPDIVGPRKAWRAIIIHSPAAEFDGVRNPFDVVDRSALEGLSAPERQPKIGDNIEAWEKAWSEYYCDLTEKKEAVYRSAMECPLQKLAAWLCFSPEDYVLNDVSEKLDAHDWAVEKISEDYVKPSARLELLEKEQYKRELRLKENIRREFAAGEQLSISFPSEILCISPRTTKDSFFDPEDYWSVHQENEYSTFADRNMYFDKMRFMVFDLLPETHRNFRTDYIRFLATVLIFATNPLPGSAMQARHLYRIHAETDETPLCVLVTSYDKKLALTSAVIDNEMERIRSEIPAELTDKAAEELFCVPNEIPVRLDESCDPGKMFTETGCGLFTDYPTDEYQRWDADYAVSEKTLIHVAKQSARSVRKSVIQMNNRSELLDANVSRLTAVQLDDVREFTENAENQMLAAVPPAFAEYSEYIRQISQKSQNVKKIIRSRMNKKTVELLGGTCLLLYLLCFVPFIISNNGAPKITTTSIVFSLVALAALAVVMLVTLLFLRRELKDAKKRYNETAGKVLADIRLSMQRASGYLSALCDTRRGYAVQNCARRDLDEYTKSLRIRKKHQEDIRRRRAYIKEKYRDYLGDSSFCDEVMSRPYDYDFDRKTEYSYPAPFLAGDCRQMEFISSGNFITVPSSYVTRIQLRIEGIYEK